ncbi:uncharacterized protein LOC128331902 isoform X2 [Hemicordylus capensis]|uniref:uncharacterized protein LOC128331902 isoform X2 n=1 Tax=Hemicordylus capensis TaxID=884348 RepID=UPI002303D858|nr:uncharacterized protein LOC128331902 isoform X2 [Hemicordylus capensis]
MIWVCRDSQVTSGVPPAPTLSLSPEFRVFVRGEQLHFKCSLPGGVRARRFLFYKEAADGQWEQIREQSGNTLEVSTEHLRPREEFGCSYQEENGTEFQSAQSNVVVLSVTDPPPSPVFSVTPKQDVYTSGESVDLTCSAPDKHKHRTSRILYFKNGGQLHLSNPPPSLVTLRLSPQDAGNYYCSYQVLESGREVLSLESNSTFVSVMTESLLLPLAIGCGGGGALVLLVLLACLYKRKPKGKASPVYTGNKGRVQLYREKMSHRHLWAATQGSFLNPKFRIQKLGIHQRRRVIKVLILELSLNSRKLLRLTRFLVPPAPLPSMSKMGAPQRRNTSIVKFRYSLFRLFFLLTPTGKIIPHTSPSDHHPISP